MAVAAGIGAVSASAFASGSPGAAHPRQATPTSTPSPPAGTWRLVHGPRQDPLWTTNPPDLRALHGAVEADGVWRGWAVGDDGAVVRYDGQTWEAMRLDATPRTYAFRGVFAAAPDDVWLVGRATGGRTCDVCGVMLHYDGTEWRELDPYEYGVIGRVSPFNAIDLLQTEDGGWHGWAVGDDADFDNIKAIILRYRDGQWRLWSGSNNIAKNLYDVKIMSPVEAWAVGEDGSESWYREEDGVGGWPRLGHSGVDTLYSVDLADPLFGWDGGEAGRMNHYTGSCHDDTLATQCWFDNKARPVRNVSGSVLNIDIYAIDLLSRAEGWLVGAPMARRSLVAYLKGNQWQAVPVEGDPGIALYGLQMIDSRRGFAVGEDGVIVEYLDETVPTATAGASPTASPTSETTTPTPTSTGGARPTASPSASPTATATRSPTASPSSSPTATATRSPTASPTATATRTPEPTVSVTKSPHAFVAYLPLVVTDQPAHPVAERGIFPWRELTPGPRPPMIRRAQGDGLLASPAQP